MSFAWLRIFTLFVLFVIFIASMRPARAIFEDGNAEPSATATAITASTAAVSVSATTTATATATVAVSATATPARTLPPPQSAHVPILMYHYVSSPAANADRLRRELSVEPQMFEAQMRWLKANGYHTITLDDLHANLKHGVPLPEKPIVLTFDDGHIEHYSYVFPLLRSLEMTGTFFIVADFATYAYTNPNYLNWKQAREMAEGGMRIESHARTHRDLRSRSFQFLVWELLGSIEQIEAYTGRRPRFFCYPAGQYDAAVIRVLKSVDMLGAVTTVHGAQHTASEAYTWRRIRVRYGAGLDEFAALVRGGATKFATPEPPPDPLYSPLMKPTITPEAAPTSEAEG